MDEVFYPEAEPRQTGFLKVSGEPLHEIFWQEFGNPDGDPVMFIHGGPGGSSSPEYARFFDPNHYRIILFDQRGAGQSKPFASLEDNTTRHSVEDIVKLRAALNINGPMHLFGGSWGSTLSLVYAIQHPETVKTMTLRGIFLCRKRDIDFLYQGDAADPGNPALQGSGRFYPEEWAEYVAFIPSAERHDMIAAYRKRLTSDDEKTRLDAATVWSVWEGAASKLVKDVGKNFSDPAFLLPFARIENHYFCNGAFLNGVSRDQNFIIDNIAKIAHIPAEIVHGRYDMVCPLDQATDLVAAWNAAQPDPALRPKLHVTTAGHSQMEPENKKKLVEITDRFRSFSL
jgi:proline iminopeptidase